MDKNRIKSYAFSLAETLIMITILAVVMIALTPFLTRKIQNITDAGSTIGGGAHGRIELYYQEFLDCDNNVQKCEEDGYKKEFSEEKINNGESIIVYQKLNDAEYEKSFGSEPKRHLDTSDNKKVTKDTIYVELGRGKPIKNPDGTVIGAEIGDKKYPDTAKMEQSEIPEYVFESAYVTYTKKGKDISPNRIIDGNYTILCKKSGAPKCNSITEVRDNYDNNYFIVREDQDSKKKYGKHTLRYRSFPWKKKYTGNSKKPKPEGGEPVTIGSNGEILVELPSDTKDINFHAVGGGGFGGTIDSLSSPIIPKSPIDQKTKTIIESRLKVAYKRITGKEPKIMFVEGKKFSGENASKTPLTSEDETGIRTYLIKNINVSKDPAKLFIDNPDLLIVNTTYGTITGKLDFREGQRTIYPHKLLQYTHILGTSTQKPVIYDMPIWFSAKDIDPDGKGFRIGGTVCSKGGSKGANYDYKLHDPTEDGKHDACSWFPKPHVTCELSNLKPEKICDTGCRLTTDYTQKARPDRNGNCPNEYEAYQYNCKTKEMCKVKSYSCTPSYFYNCTEKSWIIPNIGDEVYCTYCRDKSKFYEYNHKAFTHTCKGGNGGSGACAWISARILKDDNKIEQKAEKGFYRLIIDVDGKNAELIAINGTNGMPCKLSSDTLTCDSLVAQVYLSADLDKVVRQWQLIRAEYSDFYKENCATDKDVETFNEQQCSVALDVKNGKYDGKNGINGQAACIYDEKACANKSDAEHYGKPVAWQKGTPQQGSGGVSYSTTVETKGFGIDTSTGIQLYNYLYLWTIPYGLNSLDYGDAGEAGEYKSANVKNIEGKIKVVLGKGGSVDVPNGTSTTVDIIKDNGSRKILEARGGKGGASNKKTDAFDMCFRAPINKNANGFPTDKDADPSYYCKNPKNSGAEGAFCCMGNSGVKNTKNISSTYMKQSAFEEISASVSGSPIVGIGLGRGGQGAATTTYDDEVTGVRNGVNASTAASYNLDDKVIKIESSPARITQYANKIMKLSDLNSNGGGGAVIIMW